MSDNIQIPASGTGDATPTVATEKIAGVDFQKVKLIDASTGSTTGTGTSTNPLRTDPTGTTRQPVSLTSTTVSGSVAVSSLPPITAFVSSFPSTQPVSGTVTALPAGTQTVFVASFPSTQPVSGTVQTSPSGIQSITGAVAVASTVNVAQSGQWNVTPASGAIQSVTGNVSVPSTVTVAQSGAWNVAVSSLPGGSIQTVAIPSTALADSTANPTAASFGAFEHLYNGSTWDRRRLAVPSSDAVAPPTTGVAAVTGFGYVFNGTTWDRVLEVVNAQNTTGTGVAAAGILAQFDDASTGSVTENQFAPPRISSRRALYAEGLEAGAATAASNPVPVGAIYKSATPTYTNGQRTELLAGTRGSLAVSLFNQDSLISVGMATWASDAISTASVGIETLSVKMAHNGATGTAALDRWRNNNSTTVLASAGRTATGTSADQTNYNGRTATLIVDVSSAGSGSITPSIQIKDSISANYFTIWTAAAAITTTVTRAYRFAEGSVPSTTTWTETQNMSLGARTFRVVCTANNANSMTYSASMEIGV